MRADPEPRQRVLAEFGIPISKRAPVNTNANREDRVLRAHALELHCDGLDWRAIVHSREPLAVALLGAARRNASKSSSWSGKSLVRAVGRIGRYHVTPRYLGASRSHKSAQLILGFGEARIPGAFSRDLVQDKRGNDFLFFFRKPRYFCQGLFKQSIHRDIPRKPALVIPHTRSPVSARSVSTDQSTGSTSPKGASAASSTTESRPFASVSARANTAARRSGSAALSGTSGLIVRSRDFTGSISL
jgi:hypothetical protein